MFNFYIFNVFKSFQVILSNHITYITHINYVTQITYITHITYIKNVNRILYIYIKQNKTKKGLKKVLRKVSSISEEEKYKKCQYACERYRNLSEERKQKASI